MTATNFSLRTECSRFIFALVFHLVKNKQNYGCCCCCCFSPGPGGGAGRPAGLRTGPALHRRLLQAVGSGRPRLGARARPGQAGLGCAARAAARPGSWAAAEFKIMILKKELQLMLPILGNYIYVSASIRFLTVNNSCIL